MTVESSLQPPLLHISRGGGEGGCPQTKEHKLEVGDAHLTGDASGMPMRSNQGQRVVDYRTNRGGAGHPSIYQKSPVSEERLLLLLPPVEEDDFFAEAFSPNDRDLVALAREIPFPLPLFSDD